MSDKRISSIEQPAEVVRVELGATRRQRIRAVAAVLFWWSLSVALGSGWNGRATDYLAGFAGGVTFALLWRYDKLIWHGVHRAP